MPLNDYYTIGCLPAALSIGVFNFILMKVLQTIARRYPNGKTFTWKFGQLPDGRYAAKGLETGRKVIFKSKGDYNQRFRYMTWTLGYTPVVEQLALPL